MLVWLMQKGLVTQLCTFYFDSAVFATDNVTIPDKAPSFSKISTSHRGRKFFERFKPYFNGKMNSAEICWRENLSHNELCELLEEFDPQRRVLSFQLESYP
jgi:hypothetical protein